MRYWYIHGCLGEPLFITPTRRLKQRIKQSDHEEDEGTGTVRELAVYSRYALLIQYPVVNRANTSDDDDDDEVVIKRRPRKQDRDGSSTADLEEDDDDDDEVVIKRRPRKQDRDGNSVIDLEDEDEGEFIPRSQYKRRANI